MASRLVLPLALWHCCGCAATRTIPRANPVPPAITDAKVAASSDEPAMPPEPVLSADVIEYINGDVAGGRYPGLVLGLIDEHGFRVKGFGRRSLSDARGGSDRPDARTVYEIGSLTKVFTGTLLAQMSLSGSPGCPPVPSPRPFA
jgi:CubicO group peptidase (beta-lactamase class C family)